MQFHPRADCWVWQTPRLMDLRSREETVSCLSCLDPWVGDNHILTFLSLDPAVSRNSACAVWRELLVSSHLSVPCAQGRDVSA